MNNALINLGKFIFNSIGINFGINTLIKLIDLYFRILENLENNSELQTSLGVHMENLRYINLTDANYGKIKNIKRTIIIINDAIAQNNFDSEDLNDILENIVFIIQACEQFVGTTIGYIDSFIQTQMQVSDNRNDFSNCTMTLAALDNGNIMMTITGKADKEGRISYDIMSAALNNSPENLVVIH